MPGLFHRWAGNKGAAVRNGGHHPFMGQPGQHLADARPVHLEHAGEFLLDQLGTGNQAMLHHGSQDPLVYGVQFVVRPQYLPGAASPAGA